MASGYKEIHPYSAMNIDSVKINTSLIMMKECMPPSSCRAPQQQTHLHNAHFSSSIYSQTLLISERPSAKVLVFLCVPSSSFLDAIVSPSTYQVSELNLKGRSREGVRK